MELKYLVTGTGRCGTVFMARLLSSLGIMCGHEAIFDFNGLNTAKERLENKKIQSSHCSLTNIFTEEIAEKWFFKEKMIAESSYTAVPFLNIPELKNTKIIHIVRNPLSVISSFFSDIHYFDENNLDTKKWRDFVYEYAPEIKNEKTEIEKACRYYISWNKMIKSDIFLKIEDQPSQKLFDFLNIKTTNNYFKDKKINSWKARKKDLIINDIPEGQTKKDFIKIIINYNYIKYL